MASDSRAYRIPGSIVAVGRRSRRWSDWAAETRTAIRMVGMLVFTWCLLEGSRGFIGAHQDYSTTRRNIARLRIFSHQTAITLAQCGEAWRLDARPRHTKVLSFGSERKSLQEQARDDGSESSRQNLEALQTHYFGRVVDLDAPRYSRYDHFFKKYTERYFGSDADWRWFKAQAFVESNLRENVLSHKGAVGIMQIVPGTYAHIRKINKRFRGKALTSPEWNIAAGIYYNRVLARILEKRQVDGPDRFRLMFAAYNAGSTRVLRALGEGGTDVAARLPRETRRYLKKIDALMARYHQSLLGDPHDARFD